MTINHAWAAGPSGSRIRAGVMLAALLLGATACSDDSEPADSSTATPDSSESSASSDSGATIDVTVEGDTVEPVAETLEVSVGETVTLNVVADRAGELHVHSSPEQELEFDEGSSTLTFTVEAPGSVDVEEHESDSLVAKLLVE